MSTPQNIDIGKLTDVLVNAEIGPSAREEASRLVEGWLGKLNTFPEVNWKVRFVESPFYIALEPKTYVVGQCDVGFSDDVGMIFGEWKSRRAPKLTKTGPDAGRPYKGDDRESWLEEISNGLQLGVYALAGREAVFLNDVSPETSGYLSVQEPRILVRAAVKSTPVEMWEGMFKFEGQLLDTVKNALLSEAASIRARRKLRVVPYQIPGIHCENKYRRTCEHLETICRPRLTPPPNAVGFHPTDPGFKVAEILGLDYKDPELVVLSASALDDNYQCAERARINYDGHAPREMDFNLEVGTGLHTGLKEIYRQLGNIG